ncbi:hypothetical protein SPRG_06731, partial [Saprolegnia parasitica CBS 223.65]
MQTRSRARCAKELVLPPETQVHIQINIITTPSSPTYHYYTRSRATTTTITSLPPASSAKTLRRQRRRSAAKKKALVTAAASETKEASPETSLVPANKPAVIEPEPKNGDEAADRRSPPSPRPRKRRCID